MSNLNSKVWPLFILGEVKLANLISCGAELLLVQTTVVPALIVNVSGMNLNDEMLTVLPCAEAAVDDCAPADVVALVDDCAVVDVCALWLVTVVEAGAAEHEDIKKIEAVSIVTRKMYLFLFIRELSFHL